MTIAVLCSTYGESRKSDLDRLRRSLEGQVDHVAVVHESEPRPSHERFDSVMRLAMEDADPDIFVHLADDIEVLDGCLDVVRREFALRFPDLDGMIGLHQANIQPIPNCTEYGFFAVGRRFVERFLESGQPVFCPDYWHFYVDTELGMLASKLGRFHFAQDARILHHHRGVLKLPADDAHKACRVKKDEDRKVWETRRRRNLLWGETFRRVDG